MSLLLSLFEFIIDHTPVVGKLKAAIERDYPQRHLAESELDEPRWLSSYLAFVNNAFRGTAYDYPYDAHQVGGWLRIYPRALIVIVAKRLVTWPPRSEEIVACVKLLPLKEDFVPRHDFDPFTITSDQLALSLSSAKAVWVGDLVSSRSQLLLLILALRNRLQSLGVPVYCRTENDSLRRILFERYGARVLNPDGRPADGSTILIFEHGLDIRRPS